MKGQTVTLYGKAQRELAKSLIDRAPPEAASVKNCAHCGKEFSKDPRNTWKYWHRAKYCSQSCAGDAWRDRAAKNRRPIQEVFEQWFVKEDGCWEWLGAKDRDGYGAFSYAGRTQKAHRMAIKLSGREIPPGMFACHRCHNPSCVNPDHLYAGTPQQNVMDTVRAKRNRRGEQCHMAKLTADAVREIRSSDKSAKDLATKFGVSVGAIRMVRLGKTWRHVK